jgi:hypothetical protein
MRRSGWGVDIKGPGWTVVNRPQIQRWIVPITTLCGVAVFAGVRLMLIHPVASQSWWPGVFMVGFAFVGYVFLWLMMWKGLAIFAFGPDRLLVRTWIGNMLGRPPRVFYYTQDIKLQFQVYKMLNIVAGDERYATYAQYFPSTEMRKLIAIAEERGIPIEYEWQPDFMKPVKPRWQRWLGL